MTLKICMYLEWDISPLKTKFEVYTLISYVTVTNQKYHVEIRHTGAPKIELTISLLQQMFNVSTILAAHKRRSLFFQDEIQFLISSRLISSHALLIFSFSSSPENLSLLLA